MFTARPKPQLAQTEQPTAPATSTAQYVPPAPLKVHPAAWHRTFTGTSKGFRFELQIQREATGHLHGRYFVTPGQPEGWHLEGQIREDNSFALKGTENSALFEGSFTANANSIAASFHNKNVQIDNIKLQRQTPKLKLGSPQVSSTAPESHSSPGNPNQHLNREQLSTETIEAVNALKFTPATRGKRDRHAVFFNIVQACRQLGAAFPEVIAANGLSSLTGEQRRAGNTIYLALRNSIPANPALSSPPKKEIPTRES